MPVTIEIVLTLSAFVVFGLAVVAWVGGNQPVGTADSSPVSGASR